jgi:hypothetical protein
MRATRKRGRPPAGLDGAPSSQYPQLAVRVPQETIDQCTAIAEKKDIPQWQVVHEAIARYHRQVFRRGMR